MGGEQAFVNEAFDTNWVAPLGPNVNGFEADLASYTGARHASALTSGTAAIHLGLVLFGVKPGDVVMCQSFTFSASANPIKYLGAEPVFIDSEPETWNMCPDALREAIKDQLGKGMNVKAIIPVHLYGMPAKMDEIMAIANEYGIPVLEDAAEALGSHINGKRCGTFGQLGVLSFNGNKIITTSGGGALISDDKDLIDKSRFLATQARDNAPHYEHSHIGYNYRMSNIVAGIGRGQMQVLDERVAQRRANHERYVKYFGQRWLTEQETSSRTSREPLRTSWFQKQGDLNAKDTKNVTKDAKGIYFLKEPAGYFSNRWLTTVIVNPEETNGVTREHIRLALEAENIEARPLWKPMHMQPVFKDAAFYGSGFSEWLFEHGLCLPSGSNLVDEDFNRIFEVLESLRK